MARTRPVNTPQGRRQPARKQTDVHTKIVMWILMIALLIWPEFAWPNHWWAWLVTAAWLIFLFLVWLLWWRHKARPGPSTREKKLDKEPG